jgi:uncharacterized protein (DUF433 family)
MIRAMGTATQHLELREGVYYVSGTRISLDSIVYAFQDGASPESIREDFEGLTLPHVYGAISFYLDNRETVETYLQARKRQWHELEREGVPPSKELLERLNRPHPATSSNR